jgi:hypothetical protein
MESGYALSNDAVTVPEPERAIFDRKAVRIAVCRIRYWRLILPCEPDTGFALLQGWRQGRNINGDSYCALLFL